MKEASAASSDTIYWPVPGYPYSTAVSQYYSDSHQAIDIALGWPSINGAPIVASVGGKIISAFTCGESHYGSFGDCQGYGTGCVIQGTDGKYYQYAHMQAGSMGSLGVNSTVVAGQQIGRVGSTGNSNGYHLHYAIATARNWSNQNYTIDPGKISFVYIDSPINPNTFSFNANGGSGSMSSLLLSPGMKFTIPECSFSNPSYRCAYWSLKRSDDTWLTYDGEYVDYETACYRGMRFFYSGYEQVLEESWFDGGEYTYTFYANWVEQEKLAATEEELRNALSSGGNEIIVSGIFNILSDLTVPAGKSITLINGCITIPEGIKMINNGSILLGEYNGSEKGILKVFGEFYNKNDIYMYSGDLVQDGLLVNEGLIWAVRTTNNVCTINNSGVLRNEGSITVDSQYSRVINSGSFLQSSGDLWLNYCYFSGIPNELIKRTVSVNSEAELHEYIDMGFEHVILDIPNSMKFTKNLTIPQNSCFRFMGETLTIPKDVRVTIESDAFSCLTAETACSTVNVEGELYLNSDITLYSEGTMNVSGELVVNDFFCMMGDLNVLSTGILTNNGSITNYDDAVELQMSEGAVLNNKGYISGVNELNNSEKVYLTGTEIVYGNGTRQLTDNEAKECLKSQGIEAEKVSVIWQAALIKPLEGETATIGVKDNDKTWGLLRWYDYYNGEDFIHEWRLLQIGKNEIKEIFTEKSDYREIYAVVLVENAVEKDVETKLQIDTDFTDSKIPEELREYTRYNTVEEIEKELILRIENTGVRVDSSILLDVLLMYKNDRGEWADYTADYSSAEENDGLISVMLPVPAGTSPDTHRYHVAHMFASSAFGKQSGDVEVFNSVSEITYQDSSYFVTVEVTGLSPIIVCAERINLESNEEENKNPNDAVIRLYGRDRFDTAFTVANEMKGNLGVEKFSAVIVASGKDFADALSASYLAAVNKAPILLSYKSNQNRQVADYIRGNLAEGGLVYIIGGTSAVPVEMEDLLSGLRVKRLAGENRFETNLAVLKEAGVAAGEEILVCTGTDFADCLSAAAAGKPIMLVYKRLMDSQKGYIPTLNNKFCIIGGTNAVNSTIEDYINDYGQTVRLAGAHRYETSVLVAKKYFGSPDGAVLAYARNFPDGLCGGVLAATSRVPLILTDSKYYSYAADYAAEKGIKGGYVLGGESLINHNAVQKILAQ